jgi:signal transduction histidine kinase
MSRLLQIFSNVFGKTEQEEPYRNRYGIQGLIYRLVQIMASTLRLEDLTHQLLHELLSKMRINNGAFVLVTLNGKIYEVMHEGYTSAPEYDEEEIITLLKQVDTLVFEENVSGMVRSIMRKLNAAVIVRLHTEKEQIGLLILGRKISFDSFSSLDKQVLEILAPEASVAIQNAQSFEEIRRFNLTLEQEISKATDELKKSNEDVYKKNVELARLGESLSVANDKLKSLDKLKDEFLSLASHELRTPMTAIKSYLWMVLNGQGGKITEKQATYINRAYNSTSHLIKLVNDMLDVSRIESGRITLSIVPTKLIQLVDDAVAEITPRATELEIDIIVVPHLTLLPSVLADYDKIKEVLINLLGNALKFTPKKGKITISISKKDEFIETSISDTGVGIKSEDIHRLFQKFIMVGGSEAKALNTQGTGLGLYLCKSIVELHGGKIWVKSDGIGKGTSFTFSLPIVKLPS